MACRLRVMGSLYEIKSLCKFSLRKTYGFSCAKLELTEYNDSDDTLEIVFVIWNRYISKSRSRILFLIYIIVGFFVCLHVLVKDTGCLT